MTTKFPRTQALAVAEELVAALRPACERLEIAGSLRRGKAEVGDVEILFVPRVEERPDPEDLLRRTVEVNVAALWLLARVQKTYPDCCRVVVRNENRRGVSAP